MSKRCFGVDVGGTTVKLALVSGEGHLEDMWEIPTRTQDGGIRILPDIRDALKGKMKEKNLKKSVEKEKITWPQIFDAEDVARKAYGVDGIPHIMLSSPDGIILERNLRGKNMIATIDKLLQNKP